MRTSQKIKFYYTDYIVRIERWDAFQNEIGILYIVKSIGPMMSMPISAQEVDLMDQWDRKERRIEPCVTRLVENDLARTEHEGENEIGYWLE